MAKEIERKFLIKDVNSIRAILNNECIRPVVIEQKYICVTPEVRIRCKEYDNGDIIGCTLTIKEKTDNDLVREEIEYSISIEDYSNLAKSSLGVIKKFRYKLHMSGKIFWEIDSFYNDHDIWLAEIELPSEDYEIQLPDWIGEEVTGNEEYSNFFIATHRRCQHYNQKGQMLCKNWAKFTTCDPSGGVVCSEHKCRCSKKL